MINRTTPEKKMMILAGNANPKLAADIARQLGIAPSPATVSKFADGETQIALQESVRNQHVYLVQPTCPPVNENLMELILMISALKAASAKSVTVVIPYFGYARQDRRCDDRSPISAKTVASLLTKAGADHFVTVDLHAEQIEGFFSKPVDNLHANPVFLKDIREKFDGHDIAIISPDAGGVKRASKLLKGLPNASLVVINKSRPKANEVEVMGIMGDVRGKTCIIVDDIIDTGGTLCKAAEALKQNGAARVYAYITHPVLSGPAIKNLEASVIDELVVTDTIPLSAAAQQCSRIRVTSLSELLADAIHRIRYGQSLKTLEQPLISNSIFATRTPAATNIAPQALPKYA